MFSKLEKVRGNGSHCGDSKTNTSQYHKSMYDRNRSGVNISLSRRKLIISFDPKAPTVFHCGDSKTNTSQYHKSMTEIGDLFFTKCITSDF